MKERTERIVVELLATAGAVILWLIVTAILMLSFPWVVFLSVAIYLWVKIEDTRGYFALRLSDYFQKQRVFINEEQQSKSEVDRGDKSH